jgi:hypothetical protein
MILILLTRYAAGMTQRHGLVTLRPIAVAPSEPPRDETLARAAALCARALEAARAPAAPPAAVLWLAEQLADTNRALARLARAGTIAATAYEQGRADERARHGLPA